MRGRGWQSGWEAVSCPAIQRGVYVMNSKGVLSFKMNKKGVLPVPKPAMLVVSEYLIGKTK
jgi:hypothetical protein